jgi:peroxiredoxin
MFKKLRQIKQKIRQYWWATLLTEALIIVAIFYGITLWQTRHLLSVDTAAPLFTLPSLSGETYHLADSRGSKTVLYFFAPWCSVCHLSIGNLEALSHHSEKLTILIIALSWKTVAEVQDFIKEHKLTIPVLLGTPELATLYHIKGFPTYYVLDSQGNVIARDMGYSTELGLRWRTDQL